MDSKMRLKDYKKGIDEKVIGRLYHILDIVRNVDNQLGFLLDDIQKKGSELSPNSLKVRSDQFKTARGYLIPDIEEAIGYIKNDFTILSKNLTEYTTQKEIADKIKIRIDSFKEPKTPKYLSGIGTAFIPSSGGIFATVYLFTSDIALASLFFFLLLCCGLLCFIYSIILIKKYDDDIINLHKSYDDEVKKLKALTKSKKKI